MIVYDKYMKPFTVEEIEYLADLISRKPELRELRYIVEDYYELLSSHDTVRNK